MVFDKDVFGLLTLSDLPHLNRNELLTALFGLGCVTTTPDEDFALIVLNDMGLPHCRKRLKSPGFSDRNHHIRHFSHDAHPAPNTLRGRPTSRENRPATNSRRARRFAYGCRPDSNNRRDCHSLYDSRPSASTRRDCPTSYDCRLSSKSRRGRRNGCVPQLRRYRPGQPPTLLPKIVSCRSPQNATSPKSVKP